MHVCEIKYWMKRWLPVSRSLARRDIFQHEHYPKQTETTGFHAQCIWLESSNTLGVFSVKVRQGNRCHVSSVPSEMKAGTQNIQKITNFYFIFLERNERKHWRWPSGLAVMVDCINTHMSWKLVGNRGTDHVMEMTAQPSIGFNTLR